jgi:chemotaxis methyl-accepting protein methylase
LRELLAQRAPGIFFTFIFLRNVCMNLQIKTARRMRDTLARNANKDGIFSEIVCLLGIRD